MGLGGALRRRLAADTSSVRAHLATANDVQVLIVMQAQPINLPTGTAAERQALQSEETLRRIPFKLHLLLETLEASNA